MKKATTLLILLGVLLVTSMGFAQTALAGGSSCTGWQSRKTEPNYIRVLDTSTGKVHKVPFKRYVLQVMASGEWPTRLPFAVLVAGAQATKQYAWYYTLKGHWRGGKSHGRCYDVVNTTRDQIWHPKAHSTEKQLRAVNSIWGLSLWKIRKGNDRFFLTGYRSGTSSICARDADGWKLYARSAAACARKGWSGEKILREYYSKTIHHQDKKAESPISYEKPVRITLKKPEMNISSLGRSEPDQKISSISKDLVVFASWIVQLIDQVLREPTPSNNGGYMVNRANPL